MPMSCCHYSFWCNYETNNKDVELDNKEKGKLRDIFDRKEEIIIEVRI